MRLSPRQQEARERLDEALLGLCADPRFHTFMESLRQNREDAVHYMTSHNTVASDRSLLTAAGEVRCYDMILVAFQQALHDAQEAAMLEAS